MLPRLLRIYERSRRIRSKSRSNMGWYRDLLHQHERTQQNSTLKGNLMLTTTLLICIIALLIFRK